MCKWSKEKIKVVKGKTCGQGKWTESLSPKKEDHLKPSNLQINWPQFWLLKLFHLLSIHPPDLERRIKIRWYRKRLLPTSNWALWGAGQRPARQNLQQLWRDLTAPSPWLLGTYRIMVHTPRLFTIPPLLISLASFTTTPVSTHHASYIDPLLVQVRIHLHGITLLTTPL